MLKIHSLSSLFTFLWLVNDLYIILTVNQWPSHLKTKESGSFSSSRVHKFLFTWYICLFYYVLWINDFLFYNLNICLSVLKALLALKKGSQLIKYSRKGKPKFCPFRISSVSYNSFLVHFDFGDMYVSIHIFCYVWTFSTYVFLFSIILT